MVKVTPSGIKRKYSANKLLDQSSSEFSDTHLLNESVRMNDKKKL